MKVRWTTPARKDVASIVRYIRRDSPRAAQRINILIASECASLAIYPEKGRRIDSLGAREWVLAPLPYVIVYEVKERVIHILRVRHGAEDWPYLD